MEIAIVEFKVCLSCLYSSLSLSNSEIFSLTPYQKEPPNQSTNKILE